MIKERTSYETSELGGATTRVWNAVCAEIIAGHRKYPDPSLLVAALTEGVGDLHKAMLKGTQLDVVKRAMQVAAMAVRVAVEGDPTFDAHRVSKGLALVSPPFEKDEREFNARAVLAGCPF